MLKGACGLRLGRCLRRAVPGALSHGQRREEVRGHWLRIPGWAASQGDPVHPMWMQALHGTPAGHHEVLWGPRSATLSCQPAAHHGDNSLFLWGVGWTFSTRSGSHAGKDLALLRAPSGSSASAFGWHALVGPAEPDCFLSTKCADRPLRFPLGRAGSGGPLWLLLLPAGFPLSWNAQP